MIAQACHLAPGEAIYSIAALGLVKWLLCTRRKSFPEGPTPLVEAQ
jgi:hypothetical protein